MAHGSGQHTSATGGKKRGTKIVTGSSSAMKAGTARSPKPAKSGGS